MRSGAELLGVAEPLIERALDGELASGAVMAGVTDGREVMFLAGLYRAEQGIADRLLRLREGRLPWPAIDLECAVPRLTASRTRSPSSRPLPRRR